jgi:putative MATE family efflux protein
MNGPAALPSASPRTPTLGSRLGIDGGLGRRVLALAGPVILAMISQTAINQVDHVLVGRLPASESIPGQAALGISLVLLWAVGGSLSAISVGTQALTARRIGEGDRERAGQVMFNSLIVALVTSTLASVVGWLLVPRVFPFFTKSPDVLRVGVPYLQWRILGVMSMVTTISYKSWFDGLGHTRVHMYSALVMNAINLVLNVALIFGKWGFPAWGVGGSGIASMVSSYIGLAIMIAWSIWGRAPGEGRYPKTYRSYRASNFSVEQQVELIKLSFPSGLATMFVMGGFGFFFKIVGMLDGAATHGPIMVAATQNTIIILMLFFTACLAYGTATATLVGQSMGAREFDLAERYAWTAVKIGVYFTMVLGLVVFLVPEKVLHVYCKDAEVVAVARPILRICGALLPLVLAAMVFTQALFGAGNTRFVMFVEFGLHFFCLVPLAYICGVVLGWGVMGVWTGAFVYIVFLCLIMGWKFSDGGWKTIRI